MRIHTVSVFVLLGLLMAGGCAKEEQEGRTTKLRGKKVAMIIGRKYFQDEELLRPKDILEKNGARVLIVSSSMEEAPGMLRAKVKPDMKIGELKVEDFDAIVFVGGKGAKEYWDDSTAHVIARSAVEQEKVLGAIAIAPVILARAGVLKGRKATVWVSEREKLEKEGAIYTGEMVETDGNIITAYSSRVVDEFGETIVEKLTEE